MHGRVSKIAVKLSEIGTDRSNTANMKVNTGMAGCIAAAKKGDVRFSPSVKSSWFANILHI